MAFNDQSFQQLKQKFLEETGAQVGKDNFDSFVQYVQAHQLIVIHEELYKIANQTENINDRIDAFLNSKE